MRTLLYLVILIVCSSCLTARRIEKNCDLFAKICGTGTVTEIRYKDTTIIFDRRVPVFLPRDTAKLQGLVKINSTGAQMPVVTSKKGIVTISAQVIDSKLTATGFINRDSIIAAIRDSVKLKNAIRESGTTTTVVVREPYIPGFYKFTFWVVILGFLVGIIWLIIRFKIVALLKTKFVL